MEIIELPWELKILLRVSKGVFSNLIEDGRIVFSLEAQKMFLTKLIELQGNEQHYKQT